MAAVTTVTGTATTFQRCSPQTFTVNAALGATNYTWTVANGAVITSGQGTTSVTIDFSAVLSTLASTKVTVKSTNSCGVSSAVKTLTLASAVCGAKMDTEIRNESAIAVYPNPASDSFNVDLTSIKDETYVMSILTINGSLVSSRRISAMEGLTTLNENISALKTGIYLVQFVNETTNEITVKKLIKQ